MNETGPEEEVLGKKSSQSLLVRRFGNSLLNLDPPEWISRWTIALTLPVLIWIVAFLLVGESALPSGQIFAILVIEIGGIAFGNNN
jgi:hypothetical protein